jgi:hypothetical protein
MRRSSIGGADSRIASEILEEQAYGCRPLR